MSGWTRDLRYTLRGMRRHHGFVLAAVLTLTIGIGVSTTIISFVNAVLLRPLPVQEPDRLLSLARVSDGLEPDRYFSYADYRALSQAVAGRAEIGAFGLQVVTIGVGEVAASTIGTLVSEHYFKVVGVRPALGRFFLPDETVPGAAPVVVLGWETWQRRFNGDPAVLGSTTHLNGQPATVVGVTPERFNGTINLVAVEVWAPLALYPVLYPGQELETPARNLQLVGRAAEGYPLSALQEYLGSEMVKLPSARSQRERPVADRLSSLSGNTRAGALRMSTLFLLVGVLVLAIASVNVAGMLVARGAARRGELAMRLALGASRRDLVRQLLLESILLWLVAAVGGVIVAASIGRRLPHLLPVQDAFPARLGLDLSIDPTVLAAALLLALATGLLSSLSPALRASRLDLVPALKQRDSGGDLQGSSFRGVLVVAQIAVSVLLLAITGIFIRTIQHAASVEPGFSTEGVFVATVNLDLPGYPEHRGQHFYAELVARLQQRPGVAAAGVASNVPLGGARSTIGISVPGAPSAGTEMPVPYAAVTPDYFATLRIPLLKGRVFAATDGAADARVAVVSAATARRLWPGEEAVGQSIRIGGDPVQVVGVVADV